LDTSLQVEGSYGLQGIWLSAAQVERGYRLDELLKEVGNTGTMLNSSTLKRENESFAAWCGMTGRLAREFPLGDGVVEMGRAVGILSEWGKSPAKEFWADHVTRTTSPLYPVMEKDLRRLWKLRDIARTNDRTGLLQTASDAKGDEETVFAAWERWNQVSVESGAVTSGQELKVVGAAVANVRGKCASTRLSVAERGKREAEVRATGARIWSDAVAGTSSPDVLVTAWGLKDSFVISNGAGLAPTARFNLALARMKGGGEGALGQGAIGELTAAMEALVPRRVPPVGAGRAWAA